MSRLADVIALRIKLRRLLLVLPVFRYPGKRRLMLWLWLQTLKTYLVLGYEQNHWMMANGREKWMSLIARQLGELDEQRSTEAI